jgi:hypothetical protein
MLTRLFKKQHERNARLPAGELERRRREFAQQGGGVNKGKKEQEYRMKIVCFVCYQDEAVPCEGLCGVH